MAVDNLGLVLRHNGQLTEAIAAHRDAAAIHHETGDRQGEGSALNDLGQALQEEDLYNEAITAHEIGLPGACRDGRVPEAVMPCRLTEPGSDVAGRR
jgi:tetratricopeptide (TPR) repeat protein